MNKHLCDWAVMCIMLQQCVCISCKEGVGGREWYFGEHCVLWWGIVSFDVVILVGLSLHCCNTSWGYILVDDKIWGGGVAHHQ